MTILVRGRAWGISWVQEYLAQQNIAEPSYCFTVEAPKELSMTNLTYAPQRSSP